MIKLYFYFFTYSLFFALFHLSALAQVADTLELPEVLVEADKFQRASEVSSASIKRILISETGITQSLSEILQNRTSLFFRNQGSGLLATVSQNGFSPHQIRVEWNGMEINHPMLGVVDFSTIPAVFIQSAEFSAVTSLANPGAMSVGGIIYLDSKAEKSSKWIDYTQAQLGRYQVQANISHQKWFLKMALQDEKNDFKYYDPVFNVNKTRKRNGRQTLGAQTGVNYQLFKRSVESIVWAQYVNRSIPGAVGTTPSEAKQLDGWIRLSNQIRLQDGEYPWKLNINASLDRLDYRDSLLASAGSNELSKSTTYQTQIKSTKRLLFNPILWSDISLEQINLWVDTNNYEEIKKRGNSRVIAQSTFIPQKRIHIYPTLQAEYYTDFGFAISPLLGVSISVIENTLSLFSNISKAYSPPNLNALYWPDLGDPNLKPEEVYKKEVGYRFSYLLWGIHLKQSTNVFFADVKNGIQWTPVQSLWRPQNVLAVHQKAINVELELIKTYPNGLVKTYSVLGFSSNKVAKKRFSGDLTVGKELVYVPDVQFKQSIFFSYKKFESLLSFQRVGNRYINAANSQWLDPYQTLDVQLFYSLNYSEYILRLGVFTQNATNERYQVMKGYPMPGRVSGVSIKLQL